MSQRFSEFRKKEVIHICEGSRLGCADDLIFETGTGQICAIIVPGKARFFGLFGREDDIVIPWECIRRIGDDIILVDGNVQSWRKPSRKNCIF